MNCRRPCSKWCMKGYRQCIVVVASMSALNHAVIANIDVWIVGITTYISTQIGDVNAFIAERPEARKPAGREENRRRIRGQPFFQNYQK